VQNSTLFVSFYLSLNSEILHYSATNKKKRREYNCSGPADLPCILGPRIVVDVPLRSRGRGVKGQGDGRDAAGRSAGVCARKPRLSNGRWPNGYARIPDPSLFFWLVVGPLRTLTPHDEYTTHVNGLDVPLEPWSGPFHPSIPGPSRVGPPRRPRLAFFFCCGELTFSTRTGGGGGGEPGPPTRRRHVIDGRYHARSTD
jgi:hypothetical protein